MIEKFSCRNFRNINADNLSFERINILIGPNNSGKTNFIKALTFYSDILVNSSNGSLKTAFLNAVSRNGWEHARNKYVAPDTPIEFSWEINLNGKPVRYKLAYTVGKTLEDCNIVMEELNSIGKSREYEKEFNFFRCHDGRIGEGYFSSAMQRGQMNKRLKFDLNSLVILSMQFKDILLKNKSIYGSDLVRVNIANMLYNLEDFFRGFGVYTSAQFDTTKMREPVGNKSVDNVLNANAGNFVNVFTKYEAENSLWKKIFENKMKELIPSLEMADAVNIYDKLIFRLVYGDQQYDLSDVSEGTLKGLILNLLINMSCTPGRSLLAIDEPETNLHPAWQKVVGNWLLTADTFQQCFISTHSPDMLDTFTEEFKKGRVAVFVFDNNSSTMIKKVMYSDIVDELGDWELGDLYRVNDPALGGWPW